MMSRIWYILRDLQLVVCFTMTEKQVAITLPPLKGCASSSCWRQTATFVYVNLTVCGIFLLTLALFLTLAQLLELRYVHEVSGAHIWSFQYFGDHPSDHEIRTD